MAYILVLDQGTTSSRATVYNEKGEKISLEQQEFEQYYPKPGWWEQDPMDIVDTVITTSKAALKKAGITASDVDAVGITNQRETTVIWDKETGVPVHNAIVWGCRRTSDICKELIADPRAPMVNEKTGLVIDATYSASKIRWLFENVEGLRERAEKGEVLFGTVDTWLIYNLTNKKVHATDYSNASRTMLFNVKTGEWDKELLEYVGVPEAILPEVKPSVGYFGDVDCSIYGAPIRITGVAGDQHAALFGQACFDDGDAKNTYGTSNVPM
ncbi:MAG: glycerol kinase, partial [Erysipelothrix sp.]|nr:glycerol kinase [Erysipelothrix sp.]